MMRQAIAVLAGGLVMATIASARGADTFVIAGNHPHEATTSASIGNADPNQSLSMELHFAVRNQAELDRLLAEQQDPASPHYRKWLATGEYNQRFGPRQSDIDAVDEWLKGQGFTVESTANGSIKFSGTVAQAERAFSTHVARFGDGTTYANIDDPAIPARFAGVISSITGLDNMMHAVPLAPTMTIKRRS
jgi:subtilase family serine protease